MVHEGLCIYLEVYSSSSCCVWGIYSNDINDELSEPTNHTLGLMTALNIISQSANSSALLVYVSRGVVSSQRQVHTIMTSLASRLDTMKTRVVISTFGLGLLKREYEASLFPCIHLYRTATFRIFLVYWMVFSINKVKFYLMLAVCLLHVTRLLSGFIPFTSFITFHCSKIGANIVLLVLCKTYQTLIFRWIFIRGAVFSSTY